MDPDRRRVARDLVDFDTGDKHMIICDRLAGPRGPAVQMDPSGAAAPLTYRDPDDTGPACLDHHIGDSAGPRRTGYLSP